MHATPRNDEAFALLRVRQALWISVALGLVSAVVTFSPTWVDAENAELFLVTLLASPLIALTIYVIASWVFLKAAFAAGEYLGFDAGSKSLAILFAIFLGLTILWISVGIRLQRRLASTGLTWSELRSIDSARRNETPEHRLREHVIQHGDNPYRPILDAATKAANPHLIGSDKPSVLGFSERLRTLDHLLADGLITQEEHAEKKRAILSEV